MPIANNVATHLNVANDLESTCGEANPISLEFIVGSTKKRDHKCEVRAANPIFAAAALIWLASDYNQIAAGVH